MVFIRGNGVIVWDEQIEEASIPEDFAEAKMCCYIFGQTIALMVYACSNVLHIQITRVDIFDYYEWFWGKELGI